MADGLQKIGWARVIGRIRDRWASPIWILHSRHTPLVQDDRLRRGGFAPRSFVWDWDWDWVWVALGWPKGGPSVAQGPRKDGASVRIEEVALFATKDGKRPGRGRKRSGDRDIG
jgi:hypothetical protein